MNTADDKQFALRIASVNAIGYALAVVIATFVDARIPSHVRYGARHYRYGYAIAVLAAPVFVVTYLALQRAQTRGWKCFASCAPLIGVVLASLWVFAPEVPHGGIVGWSTGYAVASLTATWLRYSPPDLTFIHDERVPLQARLEGLKSILTMWQVISIAVGAGFLAALVPWATLIPAQNAHVVAQEGDLFFLNEFAMTEMVIVAIAFFVAPIRELVVRLVAISSAFAEFRNDDGKSKAIS